MDALSHTDTISCLSRAAVSASSQMSSSLHWLPIQSVLGCSDLVLFWISESPSACCGMRTGIRENFCGCAIPRPFSPLPFSPPFSLSFLSFFLSSFIPIPLPATAKGLGGALKLPRGSVQNPAAKRHFCALCAEKMLLVRATLVQFTK